MGALHAAAALDDAEQIKQLTAPSGCCSCEQLNVPEPALSRTPLHFAAVALHEGAVTALVEAFATHPSMKPPEISAEAVRRPSLSPSQQRASLQPHLPPAVQNVLALSEASQGVICNCVSALDAIGDTALHALLKTVDHMTERQGMAAHPLCPRMRSCERVIDLLYPLTDSDVKDQRGRTVHDLARASSAKEIQIMFTQKLADQTEEKLCSLFRRTILSAGGQQLEPWGLEPDDLFLWLQQSAKNGPSYDKLIEKMKEAKIDGLEVLSEWVVSESSNGKTNFGKVDLSRIKRALPFDFKMAAAVSLGKTLGKDSMAYYKAVLQSCGKRR